MHDRHLKKMSRNKEKNNKDKMNRTWGQASLMFDVAQQKTWKKGGKIHKKQRNVLCHARIWLMATNDAFVARCLSSN